jgi:hypothetical protein
VLGNKRYTPVGLVLVSLARQQRRRCCCYWPESQPEGELLAAAEWATLALSTAPGQR